MEVVLDFLFGLLWWIFLFPIIWVLSVPWILIVALFDKASYIDSIVSRFRTVIKVWAAWGAVIIP
ncbi:MAG: hypothetical protein HY036_10990 [Nitrospirae bacterium]|nr:hypothetical protein [Nitrospirota bacterium]